MRQRDLQYSVETDMKINQLRSILSTLTDDKKSSYLEMLKQIDKKTVNFLIEEKHMNPYSCVMLEQLEFQLKKQRNTTYDRHIIIQEKEQEVMIHALLKRQGYQIDEVESVLGSSDEVLIYSLDDSNHVAVYHPTRLALQDSDNQMIGAQRYLEENEEMQRRLRQKEAQKEQACATHCNDKKQIGMESL